MTLTIYKYDVIYLLDKKKGKSAGRSNIQLASVITTDRLNKSINDTWFEQTTDE